MNVSLGYIGSVQLWDTAANGKTNFAQAYTYNGGAAGSAATSFVRAESIGLKETQNIEKPALIDGRFDKTVYQLGPKEVGGDIGFPLIYDTGTGLMRALWNAAMVRDDDGRMQYNMDATVKYGGVAAAHNGGQNSRPVFTYGRCNVNTFQVQAAQSDMVKITMDLIGVDRKRYPGDASTFGPKWPARNTRAVTWNDVFVGFLLNDSTAGTVLKVLGDSIRSFSINVNNNITRYYALNQQLFPVDVAPTKRDITGSITTLGRLDNVGLLSDSNEQRCSEFSELYFGFNTSAVGGKPAGNSSTVPSCNNTFAVHFPGLIFQIEEMNLSTDIFETTINYHVLPGSYQSDFTYDVPMTNTDAKSFEYTGSLDQFRLTDQNNTK